MATNWNELNDKYGNKYKDYAPEGEFETKVASVESIESSQKKTPGLQFKFEDNNEYSFPKFGTTHWISFKNEGWRKHHFKELMKVLGATEDQAEKGIDVCEGKGDEKAIVKAYADAFTRLVSKHPSVLVAVFKRTPEDKYCTCDFADRSVRMSRPDVEPETTVDTDAPLNDAEPADDIDLDSLPF